LHREEQPLDVDVESLVEVLLRDRSKGGDLPAACVGEQNANPALLLLHRGVQSIEICQLRDVILYAGDILADLPDRDIELALTAAGDEDVGPFCAKPFGGGEANTAVATRDDCDFSFQFGYGCSLSRI